MESQPAVGVIPLGTGNDLARCLRWGGGYEGESVHKLLHKVSKATPVMMDRWSIDLTDIQETTQIETKNNTDKIPYNIINNYFSIGVVSILFRMLFFGGFRFLFSITQFPISMTEEFQFI